MSASSAEAAVTVSHRTIEYRQVDAPRAQPGIPVVRMRALTLCGTDIAIWEDNYATDLPIIQGHEAAGVISELEPSDEAQGWSVGDRVAICPMVSCGTCYACSVGRVNACRKMSVYGCYEDGSLVTEQVVPVANLHRLPEGVDLSIAPLSEPISIAMQACRRGRPVAGEKVLVSGAGPIGLLALVNLKDVGCDVTVTDMNRDRLQLAEQFGADRAMQVTGSFPNDDQARQLDDLTHSNGPSLVIDATGVSASVAAAIDLVATAGRVVCVGISDADLSFSLRKLPTKEIDLLGSRNSENLFPDSVELLSRHQDILSQLITHRFDFHDLDSAFETLIDPTAGVGKIAIDFSPAAGASTPKKETA